MRPPEHILIARLSSIGDIILTTPVMRAVKHVYPGSRISFLVKKEFAPLLENNPHIDRLIVFDKSGGFKALLKLRNEIKELHCDWFLDLHNNLRTNFLKSTLWFRASSSYSKQSFRRKLLIWFGKNFFHEAQPVYLKYFDATRKLNVHYDNLGTEVIFTHNHLADVKQHLTGAGISSENKIAVICPGASYSNKQWLPERFGELADNLISAQNFQVVFLGGPNDRLLCREIIKGMTKPAFNLAGELPLLGSAAMLSMASVVITNDSGMMHLAQSQGVPVAAIFGPTTREMGFFPLENKSIVIEKSVPCRPCTSKGLNKCPKGHFNCMKMIETGDLLSAIKQLCKS